MENKPKHTPTPWEMDSRTEDGFTNYIIYSSVDEKPGQNVIVDTFNAEHTFCSEDRLDNAAFIVRACNSHEKLLEVAKNSGALLLAVYDKEKNNPKKEAVEALEKLLLDIQAALIEAEGKHPPQTPIL